MTISYSHLAKHYGIGISGGIATGKSIVTTLLREMGYEVVDADLLARNAVTPDSDTLHAITRKFGKKILNPDKSLNRQALRNLIFTTDRKQAAANRKTLEKIVHPAIQALLEEDLRQKKFFSNPRLWFYDAALLVETDIYRQFKYLWITYCLPEIQIARLQARDSLTPAQAQEIIAAQLPTADKLAKADLAIDTAQDLTTIAEIITNFLNATNTSLSST